MNGKASHSKLDIAKTLLIHRHAGKKGIGLGKRARSPGAANRIAKMAKMAEDASHESFRDRARREYEERRAEGRIAAAKRTCLTLDEKAGITVRLIALPNKFLGN
jgi:hypothetical protein